MKSMMKLGFLCSILLVILLTACGSSGTDSAKTEEKKEPNTTVTDLNQWYETSETSAALLVNAVLSEKRAYKEAGEIYIPVSVLSVLDGRFYWNADEEQMIISDAESLCYFWPDVTHHREGEEMVEDTASVLILRDSEAYVSLETVKSRSDLSAEYYEAPDRVVIFGGNETVKQIKTEGELILRTGRTDQDEVVITSSELELFMDSTSVEQWPLAVSREGWYGYLETTDGMTFSETEVRDLYEINASRDRKAYSHILLSDTVNMVWHQVFSETDGSELKEALSGTVGINVVSPTWLSVTDTEGGISSLADASYVEYAHGEGIEVWALVNDFTKGVPGIEVLSDTDSRTALISALISEVARVGADGINVDFEYITEESAPHYLQFLRELSIACRREGLVLSVCDYNPVYGDTFYELETQSELCDYVIIMAYDEHTGNSSEAGSVSSLTYVETGVTTALSLVPAEQLIVGLPFYTRWFTTTGSDPEEIISSEACGMDSARELGDSNGAVWTWDETLGQYYGEYTNEDGSLCRIWLEDTESFSRKLELVRSFHAAGTAAWKLGLENAAVWELFR